MILRAFGRTIFRTHPLCMGGAALGDMPDTFGYSVSAEDAHATVRALFDSEINFLDTANIYGFGESERRIGHVVRERGGLPAGFVLATKADRDDETGRFDGDRAHRSIAESQERLGLDHLQIVYLHDFEYCDQEQILGRGGALEVLVRYREQGVIGALGLAAGPIPEMIAYLDRADFDCVISHNRYTLIDRSAEPLIAECHRRGIAFVNAAPYGSGMLAKGPSAYPRYMYRDADPALIARARACETVCQRHGVPLAAAALQFSLRDPRVTATIVGMTKPERVAQTLALAATPLPEGVWGELVDRG